MFIAIIGFLFVNGTFEDFIKGLEEDAKKNDDKRLEEQQRSITANQEEKRQAVITMIHQSINEERTDRGLAPLSWNVKIAQAAHNHSTDMASRNYFQHDSPEGYDFSWRYSQVGFSCSGHSAENIMSLNGYRSDYSIATVTVNGWMDSPGHRANILSPYFQSEGIGVAFGSHATKNVNDVYITQNFC